MSEKTEHYDAEHKGSHMETIDFDPNSAEVARLRRKVDFRLIPMLAILYLFSFLDRVNIGNANVAGLTKDLALTSGEYQFSLTIFFIGYVLFEVPSNMLLKKYGPRYWITFVMLVWGTIMACMSAVKSAEGLMIARFFLGLAEAGLFPGAVYMISLWYTRSEMAFRNGLFFSTATLAGAFGGILAYGIAQLDGKAGLRGWQWIFLLEGLMTVAVCVLCFFWLPNLPEQATFLTEEERALAIKRLKHDAGVATETAFSWVEFRMAFTDWRVWWYIVGYGMGAICLFSLSLFIPPIVLSFKFDAVTTQIMTAPCFAIACAATLLLAWSSDYFRERGLHLAVPCAISTTGYGLLIATKDSSTIARYVALTITSIGVFSACPAMFASFSGNIGGHTKRGVSTALIVSIGSIGGAIGSNIYPAKDALGGYVPGHTICCALSGTACVLALIQKYMYIRENRRRDNLTPEEYAAEATGEHLCDKHPGFRYIH